MANNIDDDAYIAELLKQDAKTAAKKYELVGIDAFNPRRCVTKHLYPLCPYTSVQGTSMLNHYVSYANATKNEFARAEAEQKLLATHYPPD
ncbi:hypothetical protein PtrM4_044160 [Pyrenophora tritici-repentis]|uniref:Uncharacterized protein n=1 Tax=Pyrenophora tritici-repentis TaxID=45151 RepID=A0A834VKC1_9PLEO|nr:hypothetical protein A1F99_109200 [Pyrenophora tritici-repentis]KAF7564982.1 hypothetical protein PtrM4_044160 [Pyrenophora tritici-repentis]KAI1530399.1 hypothetical protein PtrSN001A_008176 [Pyrenophora tritici-repentis]